MDEKEEEKIDRYIDLYMQTVFNYWTALLTTNTIIIAVFSALLVFQTENIIFVKVLIGFAILSSGLLILNFRITKKMYHSIGLLSGKKLVNQDEVKKSNNNATENNRKVESYTFLTEIILVCEAVIIIIILFIS